jgi:hypothetical protein
VETERARNRFVADCDEGFPVDDFGRREGPVYRHSNNNVFADANTRSMREGDMAFRNVVKSAVAFACLSVLAAGIGLAPASADDKISIIMGGGPLWDPFFGAMKKGAEGSWR